MNIPMPLKGDLTGEPELTLNDININSSPILHSSQNQTENTSTNTTPNTNTQKFEAKSITQLLNIGRKIKLEDLDLTKYLKIICSHLKGPKENSRTNLPKQPLQKDDAMQKNDSTDLKSDDEVVKTDEEIETELKVSIIFFDYSKCT